VAGGARRVAVSLGPLLGAAAALSLERACYVWIARAPGAFRRWCARPVVSRFGEPIAIVRKLFYAFKVLQLSVFAGWCAMHAGESLVPATGDMAAQGIGGALIIAGQVLNWSVFFRLGAVGVFYGNRLGYEVPWSRAFPFSLFSHPQYVGTVLSIWGMFLVMRFPHADWSLLPTLETVYYIASTCLEERGRANDLERGRAWSARRGSRTSRSPHRPYGVSESAFRAPASPAHSSFWGMLEGGRRGPLR
jgi:phosphatidyl-N-methylethanolamine N-methyltransferase